MLANWLRRPQMIAYNSALRPFTRAARWSLQKWIHALPDRCSCISGWCACGSQLVALVAAGADSADARSYRNWKIEAGRPDDPPKVTRPSRMRKKEKPKVPPQAHLVVISIPKQRISVYGAGASSRRAPSRPECRAFRPRRVVFSVIQKNRYHRSNIYSGAPMPFMQRITGRAWRCTRVSCRAILPRMAVSA